MSAEERRAHLRARDAASRAHSMEWVVPLRASQIAAVWALWYSLYRAYYAVGGTIGMFGIPVSWSQWRLVNGAGAVILLVAAVAPLVLVGAWLRPRWRPFLLALCWLVAVGCVVHAFINVALRILSLAGLLTIDLPFWTSIDRRQSDLQDLLFNEPWFFIEGLLWGTIAWSAGLRSSPRRWWWVASALAAVIALTAIGVLSGTGVIGKFIIG